MTLIGSGATTSPSFGGDIKSIYVIISSKVDECLLLISGADPKGAK